MSKLLSKCRVLACAAVGGLFLTFSGASSAAAFQVNFDPSVDLIGSAVLDLTAPCLAHDNDYNTLKELAGLALGGCVVSLEFASVSTTGPDGHFTDYVAELPFVLFSELLIVDHQLAGITTLIPIRLEPVGGDSVSSLALASGLGFNHDDCDATLSFTVSGGVTFTGCGPNGPLSPFRGTITSITQVPEPGTLSLLGGALLAGWWVRRRRTKA
ncbi:MAG TPA: PEP-CTERM sorting domain-containing protein [Casimicrobiaceae bacterium]|nr:PEP-CTERM sorting domain-containing protein [Casimicrobiaceae bacterium]